MLKKLKAWLLSFCRSASRVKQTWAISTCDRTRYRRNGEIVYDGPTADIPEPLRQEIAELKDRLDLHFASADSPRESPTGGR
jgi:hypothetical protein